MNREIKLQETIRSESGDWDVEDAQEESKTSRSDKSISTKVQSKKTGLNKTRRASLMADLNAP